MTDSCDNPDKILDEQTMWQAVLDRDPLYRGDFVYAVRSTGIYCLPTCPSRRPQPSQVTFFSTADAAESAGFRPCRRCHPRQSVSSDEQIVEKACNLLEQQAERPPSLKELSKALHMSPFYLHRVFKSKTGLTPHQYASAQRLGRFKERLKAGEAVTAALYNAGFGSTSRLYENAAHRLGMTPAAYRRGGQGMDIQYAIADTHLGKMLVAATPRGVCAVFFGESDAVLEGFLANEYPAAHLEHNDSALKVWVTALIHHLEGNLPTMELPLDLQATTFRLRVWEVLRAIPYGETRTYSQVAEAIGKPGAVRAVASACANNPVALVTPCHRVVRSDGKIGGYRWGEERKRALLTKEHKSRPEES